MRKGTFTWFCLFISLGGAVVGSCTAAPTSDAPHACIAGASLSCACTDGRSGAQVCGDDGRLGACICTSVDAAAPLTDAIASPLDIGAPSADSGAPSPDVRPGPDGSTPAPDVAASTPDATMPALDATLPALDVPSRSPDVVVASPDVVVPSPDVPAILGDAAAPTRVGFLHTDGRNILDSSNRVVRLTGLSWFGLETSNYAPHGLWTRSLDSMLDQIHSLGYNVIRVPWCNQMLDAGSTPNGIDFSQNPTLMGLSALQILDHVVAGAHARGLRIILDRHRPDSGSQSELWYTGAYGEARWIADWTMLAHRYHDDPTVIGFDLHNEPHGAATWGDGAVSTDWRLAAERAGNAVLAVNPDLLIIVEGIEHYAGTSYWWGGNLRGARTAPVRLAVPGRVVYSPHDYPASVYGQAWFSASDFPANLPGVWHDAWGYLAADGLAPVWIGEFGTRLAATSDRQWLTGLASYIQTNGLSFAFWCWNPDSGDTGGILQDDWRTVNADKESVLMPLLAPTL